MLKCLQFQEFSRHDTGKTPQESAGEGKPQAGKETSMCSSSPLLSKWEQDGKEDSGICHQCSQVALRSLQSLRDLEMLWVRVFQWPSCLVVLCAWQCVLELTSVTRGDADRPHRMDCSQLPKATSEELAGWSTWAMRKSPLGKATCQVFGSLCLQHHHPTGSWKHTSALLRASQPFVHASP